MSYLCSMDFEYKEIDEAGQETLEAITAATAFNAWMVSVIQPYCKGKVLEIGSGIGNISSFILDAELDLTVSDLRPQYIDILQQRFPDVSALQIDLVDPDFSTKYASYLGQFDSVFALNVIEHIEDDRLALENVHKLLKPNGHCIILVPAFQALYNKIDRSLHHFRRYTLGQLLDRFDMNQYQLLHKQYFNTMGIPAWFIGGKLMGDSTVKKGKMSLYNAMVPVFKLVDYPLKRFMGLSAVCIMKKRG